MAKLSRVARNLAPIAAFAAVLVASKAWYNWHPTFLEPSTSAVYRHSGGAWRPLPEFPGRVEALRVAPDGAGWAMGYDRGNGEVFARFDGGAWKSIGGPERIWISNEDFALDGREIWGAAHDKVVHWDGERWQTYADVPADVVIASGGRAWALDSQGRLRRVEAGKWTTLEVAPPGEKWGGDDSWAESTLARTDDGALWLAREKLWRTDGRTWKEIDGGGEYPALLGTAGDRVWVWNGQDVRAISSDGENQKRYTPAEMGLGRDPGFTGAVSRGGVTYFAAARGVAAFDGAKWTRDPGPGGGVKHISAVGIGPAGERWAIGITPNANWRYVRYVPFVVPFAIVLSMLAIPIWMVRRFKRDRLAESQRVRHAVELATGAAPEHLERAERRLKRESSWFGASMSVILPVVSLIAYSTLRIFWRGAPVWMFLVLAIAFHGIHVLWNSLVKRTPKPWDPIEPGGPGYDWSEVRRALPGTLAIFVLMNFETIRRYAGNPVTWVLVGFWAWMAYRTLTAVFVNKALRGASYDEAGRIVLKFHFHNPDGAHSLYLRGLALTLAGRYREAEDLLRRAIAETRGGMRQAYALDCLGNALMEMGRYDEARRTFEAALHARPGFRRPYRGLAEILLREHGDPRKSLEYVEQIVGPSGPSWNKWGINNEVRDDYWALKAWALAELGRSAEVATAIENAIRFTNLKSKPSAGATFYRAGMAMQAMGNEKAAIEYFERARDADPEGRAGKIAKAALGERTVFRA